MKVKIDFDDNNYIKRIVTNYLEGDWEVDDETFDFEHFSCYYLKNNELVLDEKKKQEQIEEEERQAKLPTWQETIDSQVFYTAMMTDTLIEE